LLELDTARNGHHVVTYNGWPLYTYIADERTHEANGQNLDVNGGDWYVMRPTSKPLVPADDRPLPS
jgi:predicted lipoprotein with Yx(FWY)xxD motif